jgi:hypothetical protein
MTKTYLDTETCGLHGFVVLIQYTIDDGPIVLYEVWKHPIGHTLNLIEWLTKQTIVGFNLVFDWWHLCKCYTVFRLCDPNWIPEEHIEEIALLESQAQDGPCLKPVGCLDLLLHSRKGPYQSLMAREDIRIRRVPTALAYALAEELEHRVEFDGIYFARRSDKNAPRWNVFDRKKPDGTLDTIFKDVVLRFSPAGGLKFLAEYAMGFKPKFQYRDVEPTSRPKELGYAPTALAVAKPPDWAVHKNGEVIGHAWPALIKEHINHWHTRSDAREYASDDVVYTRALDKHFNYPDPNDDDSVLACMVAAVRWHGFKIDIPGIQTLLAKAMEVVGASPINCNKPPEVRRYIYECMDDIEIIGNTPLAESTRKANLEAIAKLKITEDEECLKCEGKGCIRCQSGTLLVGPHPAAVRAQQLLNVKIAGKEVELYTKLLRAGKLHASFNVIGTLSSRMSGADGLNTQGIKHTLDVRSMFPLAWEGMKLGIGDFDSFEVTIADAVCNDPELRADILRGYSIHGYFGTLLFPGLTYEEVCATKKTENDLYTKAKQGFFACILYGGTWQTLLRKLGVPENDGKSAIEKLLNKYRQVKAWRNRVFKSFCSMVQPGGIGSQVIWNEPADYVETFLGFRRYFTLENKVCKELFNLARKPPKQWRDCQVKVVRRERVQTAGGAVSSALYGAAFGIQAASMRAAANHQIQSPGAQITKHVQRRVWDLQPAGVNDWQVAAMQVHDEVAVVSTPQLVQTVKEVVDTEVSAFKDKVPLIGMDWKTNIENWGDK